MKVLLGGTFDPIHRGHVSLAKEILDRFPVEALYLVPAYRNPHKREACASAVHRLAMLEKALTEWNDPRVSCLNWEALSEGPSYTVDTLERLTAAGATDLVFAMGNEVFEAFPRWKAPRRILELASLLVITRHQLPVSVSDVLSAIHAESLANRIQVHRMEALPYSGTQIRAEISRGRNDPDFMPQGIQRSVWLYIKENRLYAVE